MMKNPISRRSFVAGIMLPALIATALLKLSAQPGADNLREQIDTPSIDSIYKAHGTVDQVDLIASTFILTTQSQSLSLYTDSSTTIHPAIHFSDLELQEHIGVTFITRNEKCIARSITLLTRQTPQQNPAPDNPAEDDTTLQQRDEQPERRDAHEE